MSELDIFNELIKVELNTAELYLLFSQKLNKYKNFWYDLAIEEFNHASILKTALEFYENNLFKLSTNDQEFYEDLIKVNKCFKKYKNEFLANQSLDNAKKIAMEIETSAGEIHYEQVMITESDDKVINILQRLNKEDKEHYERIMKLK